jgi:hypothetical protein
MSRAPVSGPVSTNRPETAIAQPRRRAAEGSTLLSPDREGVFAFEEFIDGLPFLSPREANAMKLAGGELFDNLIRHASPLDGNSVRLRAARRGSGPYLAFFFKSPKFEPYALAHAAAREGGQNLVEEPFFDPAIGRWRGIGLLMCRNLSSGLYLRSGARLDRIYISFRLG